MIRDIFFGYQLSDKLILIQKKKNKSVEKVYSKSEYLYKLLYYL